MKAKQWVKDYLDFAMPLVMVVVAFILAILDDKDFKSYGSAYIPLIFLTYILFVRLFTDRLFPIFKANARLLFIVYFFWWLFTTNMYNENFVRFLVTWLIIIPLFYAIIGVIILYSFKFLKIFFANCYPNHQKDFIYFNDNFNFNNIFDISIWNAKYVCYYKVDFRSGCNRICSNIDIILLDIFSFI